LQLVSLVWLRTMEVLVAYDNAEVMDGSYDA
jgi:hypothetical protein